MNCFCTKTYTCLSCEDGRKEPRVRKPKTSGIRKVAQCGTRAGYNKHLRLGEPTCNECRAAQSQAVLRWCRQNPIEAKTIHQRAIAKKR